MLFAFKLLLLAVAFVCTFFLAWTWVMWYLGRGGVTAADEEKWITRWKWSTAAAWFAFLVVAFWP